MSKSIIKHRLKFLVLIFGFGLVAYALGGLVKPVAASASSEPGLKMETVHSRLTQWGNASINY
jgi:hypothetical protein